MLKSFCKRAIFTESLTRIKRIFENALIFSRIDNTYIIQSRIYLYISVHFQQYKLMFHFRLLKDALREVKKEIFF